MPKDHNYSSRTIEIINLLLTSVPGKRPSASEALQLINTTSIERPRKSGGGAQSYG